MLKRRLERGDTLIEVLFATAVFSFVIVTALAIMNQGTIASQRSLEITLVRQQIDAQAETLRFMHDSYVEVYQSGQTHQQLQAAPGVVQAAKEWSRMLDMIPEPGAGRQLSAISDCPATPPTGSFVIDPVNVRVINVSGNSNSLPGDNFAQIEYAANGTTFTRANGLWIEAARSATNLGDGGLQSNVGYIDFNILACWTSVGANFTSTQGTTVRLYEPRG